MGKLSQVKPGWFSRRQAGRLVENDRKAIVIGRNAPKDFETYAGLDGLPLPVGLIDFDDPATNFADPRIAGFALYNPLYNLSGQPAITLPLHQSAAGLPIGMMFGGRYAEEATLLNLAAQLEAALPWRGRRPMIG